MFVIDICGEATYIFSPSVMGWDRLNGRSAEAFPKHHIVIGDIIKIINIRR